MSHVRRTVRTAHRSFNRLAHHLQVFLDGKFTGFIAHFHWFEPHSVEVIDSEDVRG